MSRILTVGSSYSIRPSFGGWSWRDGFGVSTVVKAHIKKVLVGVIEFSACSTFIHIRKLRNMTAPGRFRFCSYADKALVAALEWIACSMSKYILTIVLLIICCFSIRRLRAAPSWRNCRFLSLNMLLPTSPSLPREDFRLHGDPFFLWALRVGRGICLLFFSENKKC